ncbi:phospholipid phosphatase 2-like [Paramacrobiotus metropolitanus]|uniref:phospholipid phosphatase 2-like n=1 Tax=Paramacrobiotus metropolitanus TaxID=2943436 RepID=UPI002446394C|nr:phospholipid phosphatase 2-like [Paramacrobiotus metropolitanus]
MDTPSSPKPLRSETYGKCKVIRWRSIVSLRNAIELGSIIAACVPFIVVRYMGGYKRGFFCNDPDIQLPYKDDTVPFSILAMTGVLVPVLVVFCGEFFRFTLSKSPYNDYETRYELLGLKIPPFLSSAIRINALYAYGALICVSITDITKYAVGRLRPHFISVCDPDFSRIIGYPGNCTYVEEPYCRAASSTDPVIISRFADSRLSFLSGHSSFSFYCAFFVIFYLETRLKWMSMRFFKAFLQFAVFLAALLCSMSRVSDNKHHPTDVMAGSALGIVVSTVVVFVVGDYFLDRRALRAKIRGIFKKLDQDVVKNGHQDTDLDNVKVVTSDPKITA